MIYMPVGSYGGFHYKRQRVCDVMALPYRRLAYFTYYEGEPTGDHFATQRAMKAAIDAGEVECKGDD